MKFISSLALVLFLSATAHAGLHFGQQPPTSIVLGGGTTVVVVNGTGTLGGPNDGANGVDYFSFVNPGTLTITWNVVGSGPNLYVYTYNTGVAAVTQVIYTDTSANTATLNGNYTWSAPGTPAQQAILGGFEVANNYSLSSTAFDFDQLATMQVTFSFGANRGIRLDTVAANPEPGTIALFGLGALGLAGLVRRRRRRASATKSV